MKKILIIKHGSLGDIVFSLPVIQSIKRHYSDSNISLLTEEKYLNLFNKSKIFKDIIIDDRKNFISTLIFLRKILKSEFDIIIDLQNSQRTSFYNFFFRLLSKSLICSSRPFAHLRYIIPPQGSENSTQGLFNQIKLIGVEKDSFYDYEWLKAKLNEPTDQPIALFIPGVSQGSQSKQWQPEKFAEVAEYCESKNLLIYVVGNKLDSDSIKPILQRCKNVIDKTDSSPPEIIYSIALKSKIIFSNDTGPGHIASLSNNNIIWIVNDNDISKANIIENHFNHKISSNSVKEITSNFVIDYIEEKKLIDIAN